MRTRRVVAATLSTAAAILGAGGAALGWGIARKLTAPIGPRDFDLTVRGVEQADGLSRLVLDRTRGTEARGVYNLLFERGGWVQLGNEVEDRGSKRIARTITGTSEGFSPRAGDLASWSGIYYSSPEDAGLEHQEIVINAPAGHAPAWRIDGDLSTWAIHIHGLGSSRAGTLRGVQVATELGYTSLVVTYRNDGEGPHLGNGRSTLGVTEIEDVDAAIGNAIRRGAERIVLFGWSMGAAIALQLAHRAEYRELIVGLVLDSPVLNWRSVIQANCKRAGLPSSAGALAMPWLMRERLARMVGLPAALPLDDFNWLKRAHELEVPTLIIHGASDDSVPFATSKRLRDQRPELVSFEAFEAGHTLNWNTDNERWHNTAADWLGQRIGR
ncbi:MAG: alpha/beta hydrolase family protein [Leucobacter sp.]